VKARHIFLSTLIDTWHCGICVLVIIMFGVAILIAGFLTAENPDVFAAVVGTLLWLCMTIVLIIMFIHLVGCI